MPPRLKSWLVDVLCGLLSYVVARWIWGRRVTAFGHLHWELLTFAVVYLLLQLVIRGRRLARLGR